MSFIDLLNRYAEQHSHRARGGLRAIAGFDFQLRSYLADFVSNLVQGTDLQQASQPFLEAFSDYSRIEGDRVVCVQVKRTLTTTTLGKAAEEAVILDEFFEREANDIYDQVLFEVVGFIGKADGSAPGWNDVQLPKDLADRDSRQERFARLLASGRLQPPRIDSDPWWRIIAATWPVLDDPFAFAREALDISLRRGIDPGTAENTRNDIAEAFLKRRRAIHFPGQVVSANDVEPLAHQSREVVLGQVPTLAYLRDGRFIDRPHQVASGLAELDRHVAECDWRQEPYIYALWIEGRSGNGKSVLLLELMRQLLLDRAANVVWLDDASDQLLPLLEAWIAAPPDTSGPCYVFVDDFYSPNKRTRIAFPEIARLLRQHNRADWPVLVTCGPPEQRQEWKASGNDEAFRTAHWLLPPVQDEERNRLRLWFHNRTGEEARIATAFEQDQGLMISMMFELREGELREFGHRFRSRLEDLGLIDALTLALALNRLYIWAPGDWLDETQSDALRRLNQDQDFSILSLRGRAGEYVRVTHPHLSNAIYQAVRERDDDIVRARDLNRAFAKSLESDPSVSQLILNRVADKHERLSTLDSGELAHGMTKAWRDLVASGKSLVRFDLADVWTNWAVWSAHQSGVPELLADNPLERARGAFPLDHLYWVSLWERLWNCDPGHAGLMFDGEAWLASHRSTENRQWSFLWETLFDYKSAHSQDVGALVRYAADWLGENEFEPDWNFVLRPLAAAAPEYVPWGSTVRLLDKFPENRNWAYVFEVVTGSAERFEAERQKATLRAGWEWLRGSEPHDTAEWTFVWERLVELRVVAEVDSKALLAVGYEWLTGREDRAEWAHVWRRLVELRGELSPEVDSKALLAVGYEWLGGREDRAEWAHVWEWLVELRGELSLGIDTKTLLSLGSEWLGGREDRAEWSYVWERLVELRGELSPEVDSKALLAVGYEWLTGREDRAEWAHVWRRLVELRGEFPAEIDSKAVLRLGYEWLEGRENRAEWAPVWWKLSELHAELPTGIAMTMLLLSGYEWLRRDENLVHDSWSFVWQRLEEFCFEPPGNAPTLDQLSWSWLQCGENVNRGEWDKIWETCFRGGYRDSAFLTAGSNWVLAHSAFPQTNGLAQQLLRAARERSGWTPPTDLIEWVRNWLNSNRNDRGWSWLWAGLWSIDRSLGTARLASPWLTSCPHYRSAYWVIRQIALSGLPESVAEIRAWLNTHDRSPLAATVSDALELNDAE